MGEENVDLRLEARADEMVSNVVSLYEGSNFKGRVRVYGLSKDLAEEAQLRFFTFDSYFVDVEGPSVENDFEFRSEKYSLDVRRVE